MRVLMIAPPGAGKGTQGPVIARHFGVPHIATGDLLRDHVRRGTPLGQEVQHLVERGELVPDELVLRMARQAFEEARGGGYVLDGLPRTLAQARALYEMAVELEMTADVALHLQADDGELVQRLLARAREEGRADDTEEVIGHRLALYHEVTHPIVAWYRERGILVAVDAMRSPEQVGRDVLTALEVLQQTGGDARRSIDLTGLDRAFSSSG